MNIKKFIAATARQALKDIRSELGDEAVILSNRKVDDGVEIIALAGEEVMQVSDSVARVKPQNTRLKAQQSRSSSIAPGSIAQGAAMSAVPDSLILGEIKSMHSMLQQQIAALSKKEQPQRSQHATALLYKMLNAGFSAQLARVFMDKMTAEKLQGESWVSQVLKRNLRVVSEEDDIVAKGGVYALIGPTGVGKTTTTAKLAARAVVRYGADKVALLTTDSYRIGAYEQLKIYGKILGVEVYAVKGADDLRLTISSLRNKHLVLIDTVGMGQRDERIGDQRKMFDAASVPRLLLLNASSSGDTLEDVVRTYHSDKVIGCIPTKIDESASLGAVLDVIVRHRLVMHYMTNGQAVPEDLHPVDLDDLLRRAFKPIEIKTPFTLDEMEFPAVELLAAAGNSGMDSSFAL